MSTTESLQSSESTSRFLARPNEGRWLGGVLAAIASYFSWSVGWLRLAVFVVSFVAPGWSVLAIYIALWIAIPPRVQAAGASPNKRVQRNEWKWALRSAIAVFVLLVTVTLAIAFWPAAYDFWKFSGSAVVSTIFVGLLLVFLGVLLLIDRKKSEPSGKKNLATPAYGGVAEHRTTDTPMVHQWSLVNRGIRYSIAATLLAIVVSDNPLVILAVFAGGFVLLTGVAFVRKQQRKIAFVVVPLLATIAFAMTLGTSFNSLFAVNTVSLGRDEPVRAVISANHLTWISPVEGDAPTVRNATTSFVYGSEHIEVTPPLRRSEGVDEGNPRVVIDYEVQAGTIEIIEDSDRDGATVLKAESGFGLKGQVVNGDGPDEVRVKIRNGVGNTKVSIDRI